MSVSRCNIADIIIKRKEVLREGQQVLLLRVGEHM